ncbi:Cell division cycle protein 48 homolog MJ1156 [Methanobacterium formicicum]|jgi:transitional endoplasmic reticulum ATPase|nr:cell division control protein Cdc48 [Methanobacterium formicicum]KUK74422.1 MAG: AAA ATPase [Methanobacterium sp. 42_16]CEA12549.1 Cell division cycle protein 48 homolog MJ1156 [Methanobacterium formicicum]CEL24012.1 Cell division cycle protein 48 homolog MJ1156 [Methanobacterium formicicum]
MKLKVAEAFSQADVGRSIARIDPACMGKLDLLDGDMIEIEGRKLTATTVASSQSDIGLGIIRIDGYIRKNAGTSLGEEVTVRKAEVKEAQKVVLAPVDQKVMIRGDVRGAFRGRVLSKGDIIVTGIRQQQSTMRGSLFDEFFRDTMSDVSPMGELKLAVVTTKPAGTVKITEMTDVEVQTEPVDVSKLEGVKTLVDVTYEDIGGLKEEVKKVREMIEIPLKRPELFERLGISPPKGVLMHGPPGTGKTLLAKAVANESDAHFIAIQGPEIMSKYVGGSEEKLREFFEEAEENAPSIVFIDEIDAIAPKREEVSGETERRVVAQLLTLMDGLKSRGQVVVIGATNRPDALDPALRRGGRFDREIEIGVPDKDGRQEVLQIHTRGMPLDDKVDLDEIADTTHGFVGADLEMLCKEAAMRVLRRVLPDIKADEEIPPETLKKMIIKKSDFKEALKEIQPSALREVLVQVPDIKWEDIGGLENAKQELREAVEWPLKYPESFDKFGVTPPKGVLIYGPPGTGKTLLAKAVANESQANFIAVKGPELLSKWVGESEKGVREVFRKARQTAPTVIFFDEIDSIASARSGSSTDSGVTQRVVNQLLTEIDGLEELQDVAVIAATNRVDIMDPALLRPGRFDRHVKVDDPDEKARLEIFKVHTKDMPLADDVDLDYLAKNTAKYVGADIEAVCREAVMLTLREDLKAEKVNMEAFKKAMKKVKTEEKVDMVQYH